LVTPPPVAVTVRIEVPAAAVEAAANVKVLLPLPGEVILVGAKVAVTPVGSPLMDNVTAALNPFTRAVVNVMGIDPPGATLAWIPTPSSCLTRFVGKASADAAFPAVFVTVAFT
jgi:hypothetical protein